MVMVEFIGSDNVVFEVDAVTVTKCSYMIKSMLESPDVKENEQLIFIVDRVKGDVLRKIIEWATYHANDNDEDEESDEKGVNMNISNWYSKFFEVDRDTLFDLIKTAHSLGVKKLTATGCQFVANMIEDKEPEEIREFFGIEGDFKPKEEARIRRENKWTEERA